MALAMIPSAAKFVGGIFQGMKGRKILKNAKLPGYEIAPEFEQNIGLAKSIKNMGGMPSAQYNRGLQDVFRNANFGMSQLQGRRAATAGVSSIVQRMNDATNNLNIADANMAQQNFRMGTQMQMGANSMLGQQRNMKQQWEKFNPYLRKLSEGQALVGSGMQNVFGGLSDASSILMYDQYMKGQK